MLMRMTKMIDMLYGCRCHHMEILLELCTGHHPLTWRMKIRQCLPLATMTGSRCPPGVCNSSLNLLTSENIATDTVIAVFELENFIGRERLTLVKSLVKTITIDGHLWCSKSSLRSTLLRKLNFTACRPDHLTLGQVWQFAATVHPDFQTLLKDR